MLWRLLVAVVFLTITAAQHVYIAAPHTIRIGAEQRIAYAIDGEKSDVLKFYIQDYPGRNKNITQAITRASPGVPGIVEMTVIAEELPDSMTEDPSQSKYVSLVVHGRNFHKELVIPLSMQSGYVYVATDKPIYTPKEKVNFRVVQLNEEGKPSDMKFRLQIRNPKDIIVRDTTHDANSLKVGDLFFTPGVYTFPPYPKLGFWSVTVLYGYQFLLNETVHFELQEYVLPLFTLNLTVQEVILPSDKVIRISVDAKFVYGKPVEGLVTFKFGVKGEAPETLFFAASDTETLNDGTYSLSVNTSELKRHKDVGWFPDIEGSRLVVEATVTDFASGQKENVTESKSLFTSSPLVISFQRSLSDFKPGLNSIIEADVKFKGGRPASGVQTSISAIANGNLPLLIKNSKAVSDDEGRVSFSIQPEMSHESVTITVVTNAPKYGRNQAVGRHTQVKYRSINNAYIAINRRSQGSLKPGSMFDEVLDREPELISNIYYLIISKGKILDIMKLPEKTNFKHQKIQFPVTHDMVPSFRIIAFADYKGELIADSLKVHVTHECNPDADITVVPKFQVKQPGAEGKFTIRGAKSTHVGLLAVDTAVYALSKKDLLTKSKMFEVMESHDSGCGPGGGSTVGTVLGNAGVLLMTSNYSPPPHTSERSCEEKVRRKRNIIDQKLKEYRGRLPTCCALGLSRDIHGRTCEQRVTIIAKYLRNISENYTNCTEIFLECCEYESEKKLRMRLMNRGNVQQARMGGAKEPLSLNFMPEDEENRLEADTNPRTDFREIWMFKDILIGPDGEAEHRLSLPHSITTWVIQAVSVNKEYGMCVTEPQTIESFKAVFLQVNLPYSVVRNEQIEVRATVFNYGWERITPTVYMYGVKDLCTGSEEGKKSERKRLIIEPHSAQSVTFPIIPLKQDVYDITVVALTTSDRDIVIKKLNVVAEGYTHEESINVYLDPLNQQKRNRRHSNSEAVSDYIDESQKLQVTSLELNVPKNIVPGTETCTVTALGDQFGPTVETCLENPESLLSGPHGCGEQNMIYFAPTIYTMRYLKSTNRITAEKEAKGYDLIRTGYSHQLSFRKDDGSFGAYLTTPSSVWLTAFAIKVFCQANKLVYIDKESMCSGLNWILSNQQPDGSFIETHPVYHKDMMGGVQGQAPLTAYVLLTLEECGCGIPNMQIAKARAVTYLEEHLGDINEPLPVAIAAYALALLDSELKEAANSKLLALGKYDHDQNTFHWDTGSSAFDVEATSYGLLTQLQLNDMVRSNSIVNWLNTKRLASGAFVSTQDTVVALHALSEYAMRARTPGINLISNITSSGDMNFFRTLSFQEDNALVLQEVKIDKLGGMLFVNTAGHGVGVLNVKLRYNIPQAPETLCRFDINGSATDFKEEPIFDEFDGNLNGKDTFIPFLPDDQIRAINVKMDAKPEDIQLDIDPRKRPHRSFRIANPIPERRSRKKREDKMNNSNRVQNLQICTRYLGDRKAEMTIVDVGVFSGYQPILEDLDKLEKSPDHLIERYEVSGKGVVFYLESAPNKEPYCFNFRITREYIVGETQSSIIKVYEFYNPDERCTIFYSPDKNSALLHKLCSNGICQCAEGGCPSKKPFSGITTRPALKKLACEEHDYVWKGKVIGNVVKQSGFLRIQFRIDDVLKAGIEKKDLIVEETRLLLARDNCENAELLPDQTYLIMGKDGEKHEDEKGEIRPRYLLDKTARFHIWLDIKPSLTDTQKAQQFNFIWLGKELKKGCDS